MPSEDSYQTARSAERTCPIPGFLMLRLSLVEPAYRTFHFYTPPHDTLDARVSVRPSVRFSFPDGNLSKNQGIFTKLGVCTDIVEIWFGIANRQISSNFYGIICPRHTNIFVSG